MYLQQSCIMGRGVGKVRWSDAPCSREFKGLVGRSLWEPCLPNPVIAHFSSNFPGAFSTRPLCGGTVEESPLARSLSACSDWFLLPNPLFFIDVWSS